MSLHDALDMARHYLHLGSHSRASRAAQPTGSTAHPGHNPDRRPGMTNGALVAGMGAMANKDRL